MNSTILKPAKVGRALIDSMDVMAGVSDSYPIVYEASSNPYPVYYTADAINEIGTRTSVIKPNTAFNCYVGTPKQDASGNWFCDTSGTFPAGTTSTPISTSTPAPTPVPTPTPTATPATTSDAIANIKTWITNNPMIVLGGAAVFAYFVFKK